MKRPPIQLSVLSAPQAPKNAPMSIMPSSPMFTTPLRSENIPPSAAKRSGVVKTSVSEMRVDHVMTSERCPALARVTETPPSIPIRPLVIASQPGRRAPSCTAQAPAATPRPPTTSGTAIERDVTGGSVSHSATMPSPIPALATCPAVTSRFGRISAYELTVGSPVVVAVAASCPSSTGRG